MHVADAWLNLGALISYVPYKYAIEKFVNIGCVDKDQINPTAYCVLTAKSKVPGVSLTDFLVFTPKWSVTEDTFRPPVRDIHPLVTRILMLTCPPVLPQKHVYGSHGSCLRHVRG